MHLDPDDFARDVEAWPVAPAGPDTPTEAWPKVRPDVTRLALERLGDVAAPTEAVPVVPARTTPPPSVRPIPTAVRSRAAHPSAGRPAPAVTPEAVQHIARILEAAPAPGPAARIRRIGWWGLFGWRPLDGPTLHEIAEARQRVAEAEERRRHRHQRHMDRLETVRAYLGVLALVLLVLLIGSMAYLCFGIMMGMFTWGPTSR